MKKKLLSILLTAVFIFSLTACGKASAESSTNAASSAQNETETVEENKELVPVRVGIDAQQLAYVQIVAKEKGFFEENGLDVTLVNYAVGIDTINAVVLGEVEIGAAYDYAAATRLAEKTNLRLTSSFVVNSDDTLWFETSDPDIKTAADLKGKKIALTKGTMQEYVWAKELESAGLTSDDVEFEYFGSGGEVVTAYVSGKADAVQGEKNFETQYEALSDRHTLNYAADLGVTNQAYICADDTFAKENNEALIGYYKGLQEALDYIESNKDDAAQIAADYLTLSKDDILTSLNSYIYELRFTQEDYDHVQNIADWCKDNGITDEINVSDYLNIDAISEYVPDKVTYQK